MKKEFEKEVSTFKEYIVKYRWCIFFSSFFLFVIYGTWLFNINPRIDTEVAINYPKMFYNWLEVGRQGLVLTEYIFGLRWFNPYVSTVFGYCLLCVSGVLFGYVFWRCKPSAIVGICGWFGVIYFCSPIFVEQFYFELQIFQIAWAFVITALEVGFSYYGILKKNIYAKLLAIFFMIWSFSSYQVFAILHVAAVAICYALLCQKWNMNSMEDKQKNNYWSILIWQIVLFVIAMLINTLITKTFFSGSEYLDMKILWGKGDYFYHFRAILGQIYKSYIGADTFYTIFYGIISIAVLISTVLYLIRNKNLKMRGIYFLAVCFIQMCPFLLTIYLGDAPTIRAQLIYPFVMAGNIILLANYVRNNYMKIIIVALAIGAVWSQSQISMRLIYTQNICEQEDIRLAGYIEQRISEVSAEEKPIAFVGNYSNRLNDACLKGEMIGISMFACDYLATPHYMVSSSRACNLAKVLGFPFEEVTEEQMLKARKIALKMPVWPEQGAVVDAGDFVIVKLSEDEWPEELKTIKLD